MMSSTNESDPFLQVQADVLAQLTSTRSLFTSYLRIRSLSSSSSAVSPELQSARADLEASLSDLREDIEDLELSVRAVEVDPYKYGLEIEEVTRRRRVVGEVKGEVEDMVEEIRKGTTATGAGGGTSGASTSGRGGGGLAASHNQRFPDPSSFEDPDYDSDAYEAFEQQQQQRIMAEQDEQLDGVYRTVGVIRQQADDMGRELGEQAVMLEGVEVLADRVGGRLQTGMKKMGEVVRQNEDAMSSCCIAVLIFVLILLLVLLLIL